MATRIIGVTVLTLACTGEEFNKLHACCDVRKDVDYVMVPRKALVHLLYDHSQVIASYLEDMDPQFLRFEDGDGNAQKEALKAFLEYANIELEPEEQENVEQPTEAVEEETQDGLNQS